VLGRRSVMTMSLSVGLMFALPIATFGAPMYPESGWRSTALWVVVASVLGLVVTSVVAERRQQAETAERNSSTAAATLKVLDEVAAVARDISWGVDARERVCAAAVSGTNATLVTIVERRGGAFAITGSVGVPMDLRELQSSVQPAASLSAYFSQERVFVPDVTTNRGVSPLIVQKTGLASILYEPIIRHGRSVGVLSVGWSTPHERVDAKDQAVISYLAAEAGSAIERSDLLTRLDVQARTDDLTSIANRRAWDDELADAVAGQAPVCVAMIDIDHFKAFNDDRGHLAGDRLLQECATAWERQIRPGDLLARYGGEEFAVLLRDCRLRDATGVLERVRLATPGGVTCSLGVEERRFSDTPDELVARADAALYRAKRDGRNRLRVA
jgi:diguanylate cyclase (GGDEF)-like protein